MTGDPINGRPAQSRLMATLVLVAVLIAGGAAGVVIDRMFLLRRGPRFGNRPSMSGEMGRRGGPPSPEMRKRFSDRIAKELGLTAEQQVKVDTIMTRQFEGMRKASAVVQPTIDSLVRAAQASMDSVLTPEQRTKVTELRKRPRPPRGP